MQLYELFHDGTGYAVSVHPRTPPSGSGMYLANEADAHIAELERSHHAAVIALKGELIQAQQAIQRMTVEAMAMDQRIRDGDARAAELVKALRTIKTMTDADDPESYRSDDREGCLDAAHSTAVNALMVSGS